MNENTHGAKPNDGESTPENPAQDHNNNGSESSETKSTADENQQPEKDKKQRRTLAERLANAQKRKQRADEDERKLLKSLADAARKETNKFKAVLGGAALHEIKTMKSHEGARNLLVLLRNRVTKEDQCWADANFDRLAIQILELRKQEGRANGESPPQT